MPTNPLAALLAAPPAIDPALRDEQVRLLYRFSVVGYLATLLVVLIIGAIVWENLARPALFAWFVAICLVTIARYALYKVFLTTDPHRRELPRWEARFLVGSTVTAILWGLIGTALLPDAAHPAQRMSVALLITLLLTGAVAYYAPHRFAYKITAFLGLVPLAVNLGIGGDVSQRFLSGLLLILAGLLPYVHTLVHSALIDSLSARRARDGLSNALGLERERLQTLNDALAEEMVGRLKAQQAEILAAQKVRMHFERTPLAVIEWDKALRVTAWNPAAAAIFGHSAQEALGRTASELVVAPAELAAAEAMFVELAEAGEGNKTLLGNVTRDGRRIQCEWYNTPLVEPGGRTAGYASLVQDVTERLNTERTIHYMAHHDALTGLPNRRLLQDRLGQAILAARRRQRHVGVLFLDLDRFKILNDTLGHETGDRILKDVAERLQGAVREIDTVSREGGDEFVVVLPDLERPEHARVVADKILQELARPLDVDGHEIHLSCSIGISHFPNDASEVAHLLKHADSAMYQAKDAGRNTIRFFTGELNFLMSRRLETEGRLRRAIDNREFVLAWQPQVELATGRITGMEALIRWNDPQKGEVAPDDFIYIAEELGLIVPIGEWVLREACTQLKAWEDEGLAPATVSINISPRQFMSRRLVPSLLAILRETGADPRRIELEITETMIMRNLEQSILTLEKLRAIGMQVAVDDFGVGYSSLGQLRKLPASSMKIDRSFIANIPDDASSGSITEAIIAMAKRLKLRVIAEGVETRQQLDFLRANQCEAFQGFLFSRPVAPGEATAMLRAQELESAPPSSAQAAGSAPGSA